MPLIKDGRIVDDPWVFADTPENMTEGAPVALPFAVWAEHRAALRGRNAPLGVRLAPDDAPEDLSDDLDALSLVVLEFPAMGDGRAFSQARVLRERYGFAGEIRATGDFIIDQAQFLRRCGVDAVALPDESSARAWLDAEPAVTLYYQPAAGGDTPLQRLRRERAG